MEKQTAIYNPTNNTFLPRLGSWDNSRSCINLQKEKNKKQITKIIEK
jgi:hypothetical protein